MNNFCKDCGAPLRPGAKFCPACGGAATAIQPVQAGGMPAQPAGEFIPVPPGGEISPRGLEQDGAGGTRAASPGCVNIGVRTVVESLKQFLRNPRQFLPTLVLVIFWFVLSLLVARGINPLPVKVLSFLTFAQGGMYAGVWGAVGGVIGKAVFAYFFSVLIMPLFSGKNPFKQMGAGFKGLSAGLAIQSGSAAAELMLGLGPALILFNFFTGNAGFVNSMAGIAGFFLALKMLWSRGGLVRSMLIAGACKLSRGRIPSEITINRAVSGFAAGSALGVILSAAPLPYLPYLLGAIALIAGIIIRSALKTSGEVPAV